MIVRIRFDNPPIVVGFRKIRLEFNGPIIVRYGLTRLAQLKFGIPPIVVGSHIVRLEFNSPIIVRYSTTMIV